jgi:hypothetical protein
MILWGATVVRTKDLFVTLRFSIGVSTDGLIITFKSNTAVVLPQLSAYLQAPHSKVPFPS